MDKQGITGTINKKREVLERMMSNLEVLNTSSIRFVVEYLRSTKAAICLRAPTAFLCREKMSIFDRALFCSLGRVANLSLEGVVCKQSGFPVNFGSLGCRRAEDIALPSFLGSMNSVREWVGGNYSF